MIMMNFMKKLFALSICLLLSVIAPVYASSHSYLPHGTFSNETTNSPTDESKIETISASSSNGSNWMSTLGDKHLTMINIPGTHDSGTQWVPRILRDAASCQDDSIATQLAEGIRYLDIRVDDDMYIRHGGIFCFKQGDLRVKKNRLTLNHVLDAVRSFLDKNQTETVILQIKREGSDGDATNFVNRINAKFNEYNSYYYKKSDTNINSILLKDVRKKFLVFSRSGTLDGSFQYNNWQSNSFQSASLNSKVAYLQDDYNLKKSSDKINSIQNFYNSSWEKNPTEDNFLLNFASCVGILNPRKIAAEINPKLSSFITSNSGKRLGTIMLDNANADLVAKIYNTNF